MSCVCVWREFWWSFCRLFRQIQEVSSAVIRELERLKKELENKADAERGT